MERTEQFRLDVKRLTKAQSFDSTCTDAKEGLHFFNRTVKRLIHGTYSPECYAFILPKKKRRFNFFKKTASIKKKIFVLLYFSVAEH